MKNRICVVGDLMLDHYLFGSSHRISPEAPVPVVEIEEERNTLGGAGNVVENLISLGANVDLFSVIGDDESGKLLKECLRKLGVSSNNIIIESNRITTKKSRIISRNQQLLRVDREIVNFIGDETQEALVSKFEKQVDKYDAIILSDYAKGVLSPKVCNRLISISNSKDVKTFIDPKGFNYIKYSGAFLVKPNKKEAEEAFGRKIENDDALDKAGAYILDEFDISNVVITLSEEGLVLIDKNTSKHVETLAKEIYDVTGAGDTVLSSMVYFYSKGYSLYEACELGNIAAAIVLGRVGSSTTTVDEIMKFKERVK